VGAGGPVFDDDAAEALRKTPQRTDGFASYVHAEDVARGYALAVEQPRPGFEAYHFSAAEVNSLHPLTERLREHQPQFPPLPADWPAFKSPLLTTKLREHFGWEPTWNAWTFTGKSMAEPRPATG
jgi:nucleoside-diphosphate-sugar epimerase